MSFFVTADGGLTTAGYVGCVVLMVALVVIASVLSAQKSKGTGMDARKLAFTIVSERLVVHIGSDGVGIWFLFGEGDVIVYSVTFAECFGFLFHQFLEEFSMFGRDSEVYVDFTTFSGCIHSAFGKMFFQWST